MVPVSKAAGTQEDIVSQLPGVGRIADVDDIAPQGTVITEQHVKDHQDSVNAAHQALGLPAPFPTDQD